MKPRRSLRGAGVAVTALLLAGAAGVSAAADRAADSAAADQSPHYVVVLADGTVLAARTRPVSAFGKVRFVDAEGRALVLQAGDVDLAATRERALEVEPPATAGTLSFAGIPAAEDTAPVDDADEIPVTAPRRDPPVQVYSATWCGPCRMLHEFLVAQQIGATVTEVDRLPPAEQERAKAEMLRLTGRVSYPTVVIGGQVHAGFSPQWIMAALGRVPRGDGSR